MSETRRAPGTVAPEAPRAEGLRLPESGPRITAIEIIAIALSALWLGACALFLLLPRAAEPLGWAGIMMTVLAALLPVALIWVAASAARTARALREEAARLQAAIDRMQGALGAGRDAAREAVDLDLLRRLEEIAAAQKQAQTQLAHVVAMRATTQPAVADARAAMTAPAAEDGPPQPMLGLGTPAEALDDPITVAEFVKALDFPENERDSEGFRTLRKALRDRHTQRLVRASQDVLTLLSQDGIYMDDLRPDRARPEVWRRFARGERGRQIAGLGGVRDRSSLALASGRMKQDPVFRDAVHHFLRHFDQTFLEFERHATDEDIIHLANTRTARAFMLLGRVTGIFD